MTRKGWTTNGKGSFQDKDKSGLSDITQVGLTARPTSPPQYKIAVTGKNGAFAVDLGSLPLTVFVGFDVPRPRTDSAANGTSRAAPSEGATSL